MEEKDKLNKLAVDVFDNLTKEGVFEQVRISSELIKSNPNPKDTEFYLTRQDELDFCYGETVSGYYSLKAELKTYLAISKNQKRIEAIAMKEKVPADGALEEAAIAEVDMLYKSTIVLEGWVERISNHIKTCRSHTYSERDDKLVNKDTQKD